MEIKLIFEPKGKAREYSPLALNVYANGCDHGCRYCYCKSVARGDWGLVPRARSLAGLEREAAQASRQILLSFISDPYCAAEQEHRQTRNALAVLHAARCSVAILTKGGTRCLDDLEIFRCWPDGRIKVGATLTFEDNRKCMEWEPGARVFSNRLLALRQLHEAGIRTWASIEPVIEPAESLAVIEASWPYVDAYKVGRWNHDARSKWIDWAAFGKAAVDMIRSAGKALYVKLDLQPHFPPGYLTASETDMDALTLPDRPQEESR